MKLPAPLPQPIGAPAPRPLAEAMRPRPSFVDDWHPIKLFANGELGCIYDVSDRTSVYTDIAMTTLAMAENDAIATIADLSGNGIKAARINTTQRPLLIYMNGSYRRRCVFDGVDDSLTAVFPDMGTNVTSATAVAGIGESITGGLTIAAGNVPFNTNFTAKVVINRALTVDETARLRRWLRLKAGVEDTYNVAYGADPDEILDVFHSSGHPEGPMIVMVHGGGWRTGTKVGTGVVKNKLLHWVPKGFTFVSVGYKTDVGTDPIDQARSVAKALAFCQQNAAAWGCNPAKIILMGHSAGGHLVALVHTDLDIQRQASVAPWLATIPLDAAGYNIVDIMETAGHNTLYDEPWGISDTAHWEAGSPILRLSEKALPAYIVVSDLNDGGESDYAGALAFENALLAHGGTADLLQVSLAHTDVNDLLGTPGAYTDAVDAFITSLGL